jgi:hypothetical protein
LIAPTPVALLNPERSKMSLPLLVPLMAKLLPLKVSMP